MRIDLFCQVVDNYGDIGVCWRLAQQLQHHCQLRLFVDDLQAFQRIEPLINPSTTTQKIQQTEIGTWASASSSIPANVVIEAFGCELPSAYQAIMPNSTQLWINLEYLSAEDWVESTHTLPSPQANGVTKYFFFPGFTPKTGGLLRPCNSQSTSINSAFWQRLGLEQPPSTAKVAFVFPYPQAPLDRLYQSLVQDDSSWTVLLAATAPAPSLAQTQTLTIHRLPFVAQADFDALLDYADLNLVRGEDSFVRAIWAQKPFIWQPYIQDEDAHLDKLQAWLQTTSFDASLQQLIWDWNTGLVSSETLKQTLLQLSQWQQQSQHYAQLLAQQSDLTTQLLAFCSQTAQKTVK